MKHARLISLGASVLAMSGVVHLSHAKGFVDFNDLCGTTVTVNTQVKPSGRVDIQNDCAITVDGARLAVVGVKVAVTGNLEISDANSGQSSELVFRNTHVTTTGKVRIEGLWDGGVVFRNNRIATEDDLRVKPIGLGDLVFRNNHGDVSGDIRLGDSNGSSGLQGDIDARNNRISISGDFRVASNDGDITVRNNKTRNRVDKVQIVSDGGGDVSVRHNSFDNATANQEVEITSNTGDVGVLSNRFGQSDNPVKVTIESTGGGECDSLKNTPDIVDTLACLL